MPKKDVSLRQKLRRIIESKWLLAGSLAWLVLQSLWLVLSSNLLPYDEYYHIGIIQFYAKQWSPFVMQQTPDVSLYGDLTRLPAYLYHYLMSFPYRLLDVFTDNQSLIVIGLRLLNIAFVVGGILLFCRLFNEAGVSKRVRNLAVLIFVATPIVPVLAAQNNYDNLMFMLTPVVLLLAYRLVEKRAPLTYILWLGTVGMLATLVKYNFIVIFGAVGLYVLAVLGYKHRRTLLKKATADIQQAPRAALLAAVICIAVSGLFFERFGVNAVLYKQVKVDCAKVQPASVCAQYSPWRRNQKALAKMPDQPLYGGAVTYSRHWLTTIMRGYYAIFANIVPADTSIPDPYGHYVFKKLLPIPITVGYLLLGIGVISLLVTFRRSWSDGFTRLTLFASGVLVVSLWVFNYTFYLKYGRAYAIQARYIIPMVLPLLVVFGQAISTITKRQRLRWLQPTLVGVIVLYVYSGGIAGWIIKSNDNWYWPHNSLVLNANRTAKAMAKWLIPH